jgi:hypothetical protein
MNATERDAHGLSLQRGKHIPCPSTPPSSSIPASIDRGSMIHVSPLQQYISTTTYGEILASQDIQRFTSVEEELGYRSPEKLSQEYCQDVHE